MAKVATVTECYLKVTIHSFGGILYNRCFSMVFSECRDLSMLRNQFFLYFFPILLYLNFLRGYFSLLASALVSVRYSKHYLIYYETLI